MAVNSLPSFAQAFSTHSLASISPDPLRLPPLKRSHDEEADIKQESAAAVDTPPPSALRPSPSKRRRVTISGAPHPLDTNLDVAPPPDSTPISPVVMGFPIARDNPIAMEKVKSMISVKQKQKALIEQRRGSLASPTVPSADPPRRLRPPSPQQTLPAPPISFARRRAEQLGSTTKKKPADILISPREAQTHDQLQPAIQSAPPVPHAGRFPMALPRLPSVLAAADSNIRRIATAVPPTPTRLSQRSTTTTTHRSPPAASVPIASTLVPPTPGLFHRPGDKAAFLAPFEIFYDALADSKQLKSWLGEQLQRSHALIQTLTAQQDKLNELVDSLVEKQVAPMRREMRALYKRVEELEDAVRGAGARERHPSGKTPLRNGITSSPMPTESYTFPSSSSSSSASSASSSTSTTTVLEPSLSSRRRQGADTDAETEPIDAAAPRRALEPPRVPFEHVHVSPKIKAKAGVGAGRQVSGLVGESGKGSPGGQVRRRESVMAVDDASGGDG